MVSIAGTLARANNSRVGARDMLEPCPSSRGPCQATRPGPPVSRAKLTHSLQQRPRLALPSSSNGLSSSSSRANMDSNGTNSSVGARNRASGPRASSGVGPGPQQHRGCTPCRGNSNLYH